MSSYLYPHRRPGNLPVNPDIHFGRTVNTPQGRGAVAAIDWIKDVVLVQLDDAPIVERTSTYYSNGKQVTHTFFARAETAFGYDEVTATAPATPTGEDLQLFLAAHSSGKKPRKAAAKRRTTGPRPIEYDPTSDQIAIGEIVASPDKPNPQIVISKAYDPKLVVVQDTVTGKVSFAEKKSVARTGRNHTELALV